MRIILFLALLAPMAWAHADIKMVRETATKLFNAKDYSKACPEYDKATKLDPTSGDLWADLGLCLMKLGQMDKAKQAELEAIKRGNTTTRLNAYYNLWKIGINLQPPLKEDCKTWNANVNENPKTLTVCKYSEICLGGTGMSSEQSGLTFCPTSSPENDIEPNCGSKSPKACFTVELSSSERGYCRAGDVGGASCGSCSCETAKDPKKCEKALADCNKSNTIESSKNCTFIVADTSQTKLIVGAICNGKAVEFSSGEHY